MLAGNGLPPGTTKPGSNQRSMDGGPGWSSTLTCLGASPSVPAAVVASIFRSWHRWPTSGLRSPSEATSSPAPGRCRTSTCPEAHHGTDFRRLRRDLPRSDLIAEPYEQRRRVLEDLDFTGPAWATLPRWPGCDGAALLDACEQLGVEGLVWKRAASPYRPGVRSSDWRKTKCSLWRAHLERRRLP